MTKHEFFNLLEQRLMMLNDSERADLLSEYEQHIEMKMQSGLSEEEAIADFGDPEELIRELLEAYHLNTSWQPKNRFSARVSYTVKSCANFLGSVFESLCQMNKKMLLQTFLRAVGLLLFLGVLGFMLMLFLHLLYELIVYSMPFGRSIGRFFMNVVQLCMYLIYLAFCVYLVLFFIRRYVLIDYQPLEPPVLTDAGREPSPTSLRVREAVRRAQETHAAKKAAHAEEGDAARRLPRIQFPDISLGAFCMKVLVFCCRVLGFFFLLGAACTALGLIAGAATAAVFVAMGYSIIGPFLIVLGCALLSMLITLALAYFVFGIGGARA